MITNERQYRITKAEADRFEESIAELAKSSAGSAIQVQLKKAELDALRSQLGDLRFELQEYDDLKKGRRQLIEVHSLDELPRALVAARISSGLSQRQLAEKLGLKEQQIQRYESTGYEGASVSRLREVADALGLQIRKDVFLPAPAGLAFDIFARLKDLGLDKDFVLRRLVPAEVVENAKTGRRDWDPKLMFHATIAASKIYGWTPEAITGATPLFADQGVLGSARFKVSANAEQKRLTAYTFYAHFLAMLVLRATEGMPQTQVSRDYSKFRGDVQKNYGSISFANVLRLVWDLGIPVLPLNDRGAFHGAMWRMQRRNIVVLKQQTRSAARWLHDVLHELYHATQEPDADQRTIVEEPENSEARRNSDEEWEATQFAADVVLNGRAEELAKKCVDATRRTRGTGGSVELLKSVLPRIAKTASVPADALANYMAFRLAQQGLDWWGAAQNLQDTTENPWAIARDIFLERVHLGRIGDFDRSFLVRALADA